jgi:hypothetical protein
MLTADEKAKLERGFAEGEASLLLSGLVLTENTSSVKDRILAGEINFEEGQEETLAYHGVRRSAVA